MLDQSKALSALLLAVEFKMSVLIWASVVSTLTSQQKQSKNRDGFLKVRKGRCAHRLDLIFSKCAQKSFAAKFLCSAGGMSGIKKSSCLGSHSAFFTSPPIWNLRNFCCNVKVETTSSMLHLLPSVAASAVLIAESVLLVPLLEKMLCRLLKNWLSFSPRSLLQGCCSILGS